jgi:hypothetical protein
MSEIINVRAILGLPTYVAEYDTQVDDELCPCLVYSIDRDEIWGVEFYIYVDSDSYSLVFGNVTFASQCLHEVEYELAKCIIGETNMDTQISTDIFVISHNDEIGVLTARYSFKTKLDAIQHLHDDLELTKLVDWKERREGNEWYATVGTTEYVITKVSVPTT